MYKPLNTVAVKGDYYHGCRLVDQSVLYMNLILNFALRIKDDETSFCISQNFFCLLLALLSTGHRSAPSLFGFHIFVLA